MTSIIIYYSPYEGSDEAEDHYANITSATLSIPKYNFLIVMGDFNAHFRQSSANKYSYHSITNSTGQIATDYIQENDLLTTNTNFQKRNGKLWTFMSDCSGAKSRVDYIMVRNKWRNITKNCEAYNSFSSIGSDHRIITVKIKLSLRATKRQKSQPIYDWTLLNTSNTSESHDMLN